MKTINPFTIKVSEFIALFGSIYLMLLLGTNEVDPNAKKLGNLLASFNGSNQITIDIKGGRNQGEIKNSIHTEADSGGLDLSCFVNINGVEQKLEIKDKKSMMEFLGMIDGCLSDSLTQYAEEETTNRSFEFSISKSPFGTRPFTLQQVHVSISSENGDLNWNIRRSFQFKTPYNHEVTLQIEQSSVDNGEEFLVYFYTDATGQFPLIIEENTSEISKMLRNAFEYGGFTIDPQTEQVFLDVEATYLQECPKNFLNADISESFSERIYNLGEFFGIDLQDWEGLRILPSCDSFMTVEELAGYTE